MGINAYITWQDLKDAMGPRLNELVNELPDVDTSGNSSINSVIDQTNDLVESYVRIDRKSVV